jgi:hypothetical protein
MATYYVRSTGGSDSNGGTSFADGWATLEYAGGNVSAADELRICSDQSNPFTVTSSYITIVPSGTIPTKYIGCDLVDGSPYSGDGQAYIQSTSLSVLFIFRNIALGNYLLKDLYIDGTTKAGDAGLVYQYGDGYGVTFDNLTVCNSADKGIVITGLSSSRSIVNINNCEISGCDGIGLQCSTATMSVNVYNSMIYNNGTNIAAAAQAGSGLTLVSSRVYKANVYNITHGLMALNLINSIVYGAGDDGIYNGTSTTSFGYGINRQVYANYSPSMMDYNCFHNNASGDVSVNLYGGTVPGENNVFANPLFTNTTAGSEDWTPQSSSPLIGTGIGYEGGK